MARKVELTVVPFHDVANAVHSLTTDHYRPGSSPVLPIMTRRCPRLQSRILIRGRLHVSLVALIHTHVARGALLRRGRPPQVPAAPGLCPSVGCWDLLVPQAQ